MQNNLKKILALVLCLVMALTLLPTAVAEGNLSPYDGDEPQKQNETVDDGMDDVTDWEAVDREGIPSGKESFEIFTDTDPEAFASEKTEDGNPTRSSERLVSSDALRMGTNFFNIDEAGTTIYRPFTAPYTGYYWIYSVKHVQSDDLPDTYGYITDSGLNEITSDDDSGYNRCFWIDQTMSVDDNIYIGARFYNDSVTGTIPVLIDYPWVNDTALRKGRNTVTIPESYPGSIVYQPFTPTESGTYRIYSTGDDDTLCVLRNSNWQAIVYDDDSGSSTNFRIDYDMQAGETYYIGARFWSNSTTGDITVRIKNMLPAFDGTIEWNSNDLEFKGTTPYVVANGSAFTPRFTVKDASGNEVDPSTYTYEYRENVDAGTGYVIVTFTSGYSGTAQAWFKIYLPATTATSVANVSDGIQIKWARVSGAAGYVIYRRAWSSTTGGWTKFERWNNTTDLSWIDTNVYANTRYQYGVKAYFAQRVDPVSGATIGGNVGDNYNLGMVGPLKNTVRITTRKLTKLEAGSRKFTAYWTGSKIVTGYQLKYSTQENFSSGVKSAWITDPGTTSKVIKSLQDGTTYYVAVRSYKNFEGKKYYGEWSNVLAIVPGSGQTVTPATTKYRALLVGEVDFLWGDGSYETANRNGGDVEHMATMLKSVKGPNGSAYTITKKTNLNKSALESAIKKAFSGTTDQDVSLFFIATHGDSSDEGQLVLTDGSNYATFLTFGELAAMLSKYVKGDVIVILESCGAGSAIYANGTKAQEFDPELFTTQAVQAFAEMDQKDAPNTGELRKSKYYVLAAARHQQDSWGHEGDPAGNYFTDWLIEGIGDSGAMPADTNKNNIVTLNELYNYIAQYDTYTFAGIYTQQVQVYPVNSGYKLFKR